MTGFWIGAAALTVVAVAMLLLPTWRESRRGEKTNLSSPLIAVVIAPIAIIAYFLLTNFDPEAPLQHPQQEMLAEMQNLADHLGDNPDDVDGWVLLGRSYRSIGDYASARIALEQAWIRTDSPDDAFKLSYAEVMLFSDPATARGQAGDLIEEVLENAPMNQSALWLGGMTAVERNQPETAIERFESLLLTNPPPDIADIVQRQIAALSGEPAAVAATDNDGPVLNVRVSLGSDVSLDSFSENPRLFLFARSTDSPMPLAVKEIPVASLPGEFTLSDSDSVAPMAGGRSLGQFDAVDVVARISASGIANEQSGDLFAEATVAADNENMIELVIENVVP